MIKNTAEMKVEFARRARQSGLDVECMMDGSFNSSIAIIAEAPGDSEVSKKLPLIGGSGTMLWSKLRAIGLTRMETYITNVAKRQVSFGDSRRLPINKHELDLWNDLLLWELSQLPNLKYVVALGNYAVAALRRVSEGKITQWRGSVLPVELPNGRMVQVVCTYNPAMIMREPKTEITFKFDIHKLKRVINGKYRLPKVDTVINPTFDDAYTYLKDIHKEAVDHGTPIAWDIETISQETACVGFANGPSNAICINWRTLDEQRYTVEQERLLRRRIQKLFDDARVLPDASQPTGRSTPRVKMIAQNNMFDATWSWYKDGLLLPNCWLDTMLAHHTLYPQLPHNLGFLTTQYTDHPYYKDEKDTWREGGDIDSFWEYNGKDCAITWAVAERQLAELRVAKLDDFFFNHVMRLQPKLVRMTVGGILMDMSLKEQIKTQLSEDLGRKLGAFHEAVQQATGIEDYFPNPKSPSQLGRLFFKELRLVGRGVSTNADNRKKMHDHPRTGEKARRVITTLNDYLTDSKFMSTYAEMSVDPDDRARCTYNQTGVQSAPGRLSSSKTLWDSGMNLQNQPSRAYPMFIADPGYGFAYFDMAQAEARLVAYFANIPKWKEQFERARLDGSYDAHRALASEMFRIPYDQVPTDDRDEHGNVTSRFVAKRCRHGLNYRMGPDRLADTTGLPMKEAHFAYNAYHKATPELKPWWQRVEKEFTTNRQLYNAYGRRLILMERITPEALESIVAFKPQSTLGDHVTRVMYECEDDPRWPRNARMVLNVHDALIALAPLDRIKDCLAIMKAYAERPIMINGEPLIIPADTAMSYADDKGTHRWSQLKKLKGADAIKPVAIAA